jgi:hypothetical protein
MKHSKNDFKKDLALIAQTGRMQQARAIFDKWQPLIKFKKRF